MKTATIVYCIKESDVLLAMKKRGFGTGKWNGFGGKVQKSESVRTAAVREAQEESNLTIREESLEQVALLKFFFDGVLVFECHVFLTSTWKGEAIETEEMKPQWFRRDDLPFKQMWAADHLWFPQALAGEKVAADVYFNTDGSIVEKFVPTQVSF